MNIFDANNNYHLSIDELDRLAQFLLILSRVDKRVKAERMASKESDFNIGPNLNQINEEHCEKWD